MRFLLFAILLPTATASFAQAKLNSPYSRFGIGDLSPQYFAAAAAQGAQTAASHDPFHLNLVNPASYAFLRATALETGLHAKFSQYESGDNQLSRWSGNLSYMALGFTLKSPVNEVLDKQKSPWKFGMGAALTPYSVVGYEIGSIDKTQDAGYVLNSFDGTGGLYRLNWSNAARYKNTAIGANIGWNFGKFTYENTTTPLRSDSTADIQAFQNNFRDEIVARGLSWSLGVQQDIVFKYVDKEHETPMKWITLGATVESAHNMNLTANQLRLRSTGRSGSGAYQEVDTLFKAVDREGTLTLPGGYSIGIQYVNSGKFKVGAQFGVENWESYKNDIRDTETFRNTISVSAGMEFIPDIISYNKYMRRVRYRLGGYYRQDPRVINGKELNDVGVSLGVGLPITLPRQQTSFVNVAVEAGVLGAGSTVQEQYARVTVGFTLNDNSWFYKRRFE